MSGAAASTGSARKHRVPCALRGAGRPRGVAAAQVSPATRFAARAVVACAFATVCAAGYAQGNAAPLASYDVVGDAIPAALIGGVGSAERGRAIVTNRQVGGCLLCHAGPFPEERFQGTLAPSLAGAGTRWSEGQLRLRIVDNKRVNPGTVMPSFHRIDGLVRVGATWRDKPILDAQQVEDVVALLRTLRE